MNNIRKTRRLFAIGDLHLTGNQDKPMGIFGENWDNHWGKIKQNWENNITSDDIILINGDISWAMHLEDAKSDLEDIAQLGGTQVFIKGNHDYWWSSINKVESILSDNQFIIQNNALTMGNYVIAGTRGWLCPLSKDFKQSDKKIFDRECIRLKLSLDNATKMMSDDSKLVIMLHYPPFDVGKNSNEMIELIRSYNPDKVIFGHIHSPNLYSSFNTVIDGCDYILTSCDSIDFNPLRLY